MDVSHGSRGVVGEQRSLAGQLVIYNKLYIYFSISLYMSKYHFNNFGGLVLFSLPPKHFFARFLLRGTQTTRTLPATYGSRETSVVRVLAA